MKNIKLIVLTVSAILFLGIGNGNAQEKESQTVIIRAFEIHTGKKSHMMVTYPDGLTKSTELSVINSGSFEGNDGNSLIIQSEINNWKKQGFIIDDLSTTASSSGTPAIITTIILSKE